MRKISALCICLLFLPLCGASAQLAERVRDIFNQDTVGAGALLRADTDSMDRSDMRRELEAARLNEANLRMEIEQMKLKYDAADSIKLARQRLRIDSLRRVTPGVPVVVEDDTLYYLYAKRGGNKRKRRSEYGAGQTVQLAAGFGLYRQQ